MTESEAKKYMLIEKECINRDCNRDCANCDIVQDVEDLNNAYDVAIQALEKQIPKKPHKNFEKFSGVWCSCGKYLGKGYFVDKPSYCTDCGQKLDWSDEE